MKKNKILGISLILLSINGHCGRNGPTHHSRANCVNNESISWDYLNPHNYAVVSFHTKNYLLPEPERETHRLDTGWAFTHRQAAVCWGEAPTKYNYYLVNGYHWEIVDKKAKLRKNTLTSDCSISEGWFKY